VKKKFFFYSFLTVYILLLGILFYFTFVRNGREKHVRTGIPQEQSQTSASAKTEVCTQKNVLEFYYYAHDYPLWEPNNKYGMYIYPENESFFELAQKLVNSSGGDWGYVLIPYNMADRDYDKWNRVFEQLRNKHLIPIIQLWDVDLDKYKKQTQEAANFLNSFLWPIKYRYISVYNEPNDSSFWYGKTDPAQYAKVLNYSIDIFKGENPDYFMINGALNTSAPSDGKHIDALEFMYQMNQEVPGIFDKLDGWASHPYPQPNFSGSPTARGRWSIRAYEDELEYLVSSLGVKKTLPVFITETGWAHAEGENYNGSYPSVETVSEYFKTAYKDVWLPDDRVRAVIPFTIWYQPPFDHFSWINRDRVPYLHYEVIKKLNKIKGNPPVIKSDEYVVSGC
jgi:hypothetical protein